MKYLQILTNLRNALKRFLRKHIVRRRLSPIQHLICHVEKEEVICLLELTYRNGYAPHNYPKVGEGVVLRSGKYQVVAVFHNYIKREVRYFVEAS